MTSSQSACGSALGLLDGYTGRQRRPSVGLPVETGHAQPSVPLLLPMRQDAAYGDEGTQQQRIVMLLAVASSQASLPDSPGAVRPDRTVDLTLDGPLQPTPVGDVQEMANGCRTRRDDCQLHTNMPQTCDCLSLTSSDSGVSVKDKSSTPEFSTRNPVFGKSKSPKSYWLRRHSDSVFAMASADTRCNHVPAGSAVEHVSGLGTERMSTDTYSGVDGLDATELAIYDARTHLTLQSAVVQLHGSVDTDEVFDEPSPAVPTHPDTRVDTQHLDHPAKVFPALVEQQSTRARRSRLTVSTGDLGDIREEESVTVLSTRQDALVGVEASPSVKTELGDSLLPDNVAVHTTGQLKKAECHYSAEISGRPIRHENRMSIVADGEITSSDCCVSPKDPPSHRRQSRVVRSSPTSSTDEANVSSATARMHRCTVCRRSFSRSDMLERHARLHTGVRPYACRLCPQVFSRSDHLTTHLRTHTGEKPYACPRCAYTASRRDMVTRHLRVHQSTAAPDSTAAATAVVAPPRRRIYRSRLKDPPQKLAIKPQGAEAEQNAVVACTKNSSEISWVLLEEPSRYMRSVSKPEPVTTIPAPPLSPPLSPATGDTTIRPRYHQQMQLHPISHPVLARGSTGSTDSYSSPGYLSASDIFDFAMGSTASVEGSPDVFRSPLAARQSTVFLFPYSEASSVGNQADLF